MLRPFVLTARLPAPPRHAVDRYLDGSILSSLTTKSRSTCAFSCFAIVWSERGWGDVRRKAFGSALFPGAIPADSSLLLLSGYCLRRGGRRKRLPGPLKSLLDWSSSTATETCKERYSRILLHEQVLSIGETSSLNCSQNDCCRICFLFSDGKRGSFDSAFLSLPLEYSPTAKEGGMLCS